MKEHFLQAPTSINRGVCGIIYCDPGIGKTTMSATLPEGMTAFISTEAGIGPLLGSKHIIFDLQAVATNQYKGDILKAINELHVYLRTASHPFEYVVIDNISELEQLVIQYLTQSRNKQFTEIKEYGDAAFKLREYIHLYRDLIFQDINVIINAWELPLEIRNSNGTIITRTFPKMSKKIAVEMCGIVDFVGHLEVHEKSGDRWVRFGPHDQFITKCQFQGVDDGELPDFPPLLDKIRKYKYTKGGKKNG